MPGRVEVSVKYSLEPNKWNIEIDATSPEHRTPIQATQHTYFQLDAFANPNNNRTIWNHTLHLPYAKRAIVADQNALPTGVIANISKDAIDDFWTAPHKLGFAANYSDFENHCGGGCHGYNGNLAFDNDRPKDAVVATLASAWSGIKADLRTNQDAIVIYTCNWNDGKSEFKSTQGIAGQDKFIPRDGCIAIEAQDYVDGVNQ
jgi:aldose 1-epimerase